MSNIISLNDISFKEKLKDENEMIIVNFSAEWCGPCKIMAPILEEVSKEEKIKVFRINVDDNPNIASELGVESIPVTMFLVHGTKISQLNGLKSKEELREKLYELKG